MPKKNSLSNNRNLSGETLQQIMNANKETDILEEMQKIVTLSEGEKERNKGSINNNPNPFSFPTVHTALVARERLDSNTQPHNQTQRKDTKIKKRLEESQKKYE